MWKHPNSGRELNAEYEIKQINTLASEYQFQKVKA